MPYRASLRKCVDQLFARYKLTGDDVLVILRNSRAKYYTACTPTEAMDILSTDINNSHNVTFQGTYRELCCIADSGQLDLPLDGKEIDMPSPPPSEDNPNDQTQQS